MASSANTLQSALILDQDPSSRDALQTALQMTYGLVDTADSLSTAHKLMQRCHYDLLIVDYGMSGQSGFDWIAGLRQRSGASSVIVTASSDLDDAPINAIRSGATDFLFKPLQKQQIEDSVKRCRSNFCPDDAAGRGSVGVEQLIDYAGLVGAGDAFEQLCDIVRRVAPMPSIVLIEGESGTGKELVARAIHHGSGRGGRFVPINCGSMTAELLESELFGHVKGAFTGAHHAHDGLFSYANAGTLFLDEIGEMPMAMQTHLLRALEQHVIRPVGGNREVAVDVRVLAATNRNLVERVQTGDFREDLYYRLNVLNIKIPALRDRKQDIPLLAQHFSRLLSNDMGIDSLRLQDEELRRLSQYDWPGNVRELRNIIERSLLLGVSPSQSLAALTPMNGSAAETHGSVLAEDNSLEAIEKRHMLKILQQHGGNKSAAARVLGVSRKTLERKTREA